MSAMSSPPEHRIALITGASGGIGRATCHALATPGTTIAVHYHSSADTANALVADLSKYPGVQAQAFKADLSTYDGARALYSAVKSALGSPSILFNNAGVTLGRSGVRDIAEVPIEDFEATWRANCGTAFLLTQLCIPDMESAGWGRIVFCSSVAGFTGGVVGPHYASSKSAIHGLVHWLSQCYCAKGITVNAVAPALILDTAMLPSAGHEELAKKIPMGRLGYPEEVAETVAWMIKTAYVTNKVVGCDGGMFAQ